MLISNKDDEFVDCDCVIDADDIIDEADDGDGERSNKSLGKRKIEELIPSPGDGGQSRVKFGSLVIGANRGENIDD